MPRRSDPSDGDTRSRLLSAAITAFASKGFHGTSTRDIATATNTSAGTLYVHHRSKEELLFNIALSGHHQVQFILDEAVASSDSPTATVRNFVHGFALAHAQGPEAARVTNYELSALTAEHFTEIRAIRRSIEQSVVAVIEAGVATGEFNAPDPQLAAVALLSMGIDVARWYHPDGRWSPGYVANRYADMGLRLVGAT